MISEAAQKIRCTLVRDTLDETPVEVKREQWEASSIELSTPPGVSVRRIDVAGVSCLLCIPVHLDSDRVVLYCHGGGFVEGSAETFRVWTSRIALHAGCRVVSVDYKLAPENPYPAAIEDVLLVCRSLLADADYSGGIAIGADSSGCTLALAASHRLTQEGNSKVHGGFLLSPSIDLTFSGDSINTNAERDPVVCLDVLKHYAELYGGGMNLHDPNVSPLFADCRGLPPLLVMADADEILLDDSIRLVRKIKSVAGDAELHIAEGLWHVWPCWGEFPESTVALDRIRQHLHRPVINTV